MAPKKKRSTARGKVEKDDRASSYKEALGMADKARLDLGMKLQNGEVRFEDVKKVLNNPKNNVASWKKTESKEAFDMVKNIDKIEKKATEDISRKLKGLSLGKCEPNVSYCDSD